MHRISLFIMALLLSVAGVHAQDVIAPAPEVSTAPPSLQEMQGPPIGVSPLSLPSSAPAPFGFGPVTMRPHFLYRFVYGDGIHANPTNTVLTAIHEFSPGVLFGIGTHWTVDFTPTWSMYSSKEFKDTFGYALNLLGATTYEDWAFTLSQSASSTTQPMIETAAQTEQESYNTTFDANRQLTSRLSLDLTLDQAIQNAEEFTSSKQWSTMEWLNYGLASRLTVGLGLGGGYDAVESSPDMSFEQLQGRVTWRLGSKVNLSLHGGAEERQILISGVGSLFNPTFGATIGYQPFEFTSFSLIAQRVIAPSLFQSQVSENTSLNATFTQRLLGHLYLTLSGGYGTQDYIGTAPDANATNNAVSSRSGRADQNYSASARLTCAFLKRASASLFYQYSDNTSNEGNFGYTSHQGGVELGYRF